MVALVLAMAAHAPATAAAQRLRDAHEAEARARLDATAQLELGAADAQRERSGHLFIAGGVTLGVGLAAVLVGSTGTLACDDCTAWHALLVAGAGTVAVGLGLLIAAAILGDDAEARRRRWLLEHVAATPAPGGLWLTVRGAF